MAKKGQTFRIYTEEEKMEAVNVFTRPEYLLEKSPED